MINFKIDKNYFYFIKEAVIINFVCRVQNFQIKTTKKYFVILFHLIRVWMESGQLAFRTSNASPEVLARFWFLHVEGVAFIKKTTKAISWISSSAIVFSCRFQSWIAGVHHFRSIGQHCHDSNNADQNNCNKLHFGISEKKGN